VMGCCELLGMGSNHLSEGQELILFFVSFQTQIGSNGMNTIILST